MVSRNKEKDNLAKRVKKLNLGGAFRKPHPVSFYADKIVEIIFLSNGVSADFYQYIINDEVKEFSAKLAVYLYELPEGKTKKVWRFDLVGQDLVYLFLVLTGGLKKPVLFKDNFVSDENFSKFKKTVTSKQLKQLSALLLILSMDVAEVDRKYSQLTSDLTAFGFSRSILRHIAPFVCAVLNTITTDQWKKNFTEVKKNEIVFKKQLLAKILFVFLIAWSKREVYGCLREASSDNQLTDDHFRLLGFALTEDLTLEQLIFLYTKAVPARDRSQIRLILAELISFNAVLLRFEYQNFLKFFNSKLDAYKKELFDPFVFGDAVSDYPRALFSNAETLRTLFGLPILMVFWDELRVRGVKKGFFDQICVALNKEGVPLAIKIEGVLFSSSDDLSKADNLDKLIGEKDVLEVLLELQKDRSSSAKKCLFSEVFLQWMFGRISLKSDVLHSLEGLLVDSAVIRLFQIAVKARFDAQENERKKTSELQVTKDEMAMKFEDMMEAFLAEQNRSKELSDQLEQERNRFNSLSDAFAVQERESLEKVRVLQNTFKSLEERTKEAGNDILRRVIIRLFDKLQSFTEGKEADPIVQYLKRILVEELEALGLRSFGERGASVLFDEREHLPFKATPSASLINKEVVIIEIGFRLIDGSIFKKAIVKPQGI